MWNDPTLKWGEILQRREIRKCSSYFLLEKTNYLCSFLFIRCLFLNLLIVCVGERERNEEITTILDGLPKHICTHMDIFHDLSFREVISFHYIFQKGNEHATCSTGLHGTNNKEQSLTYYWTLKMVYFYKTLKVSTSCFLPKVRRGTIFMPFSKY